MDPSEDIVRSAVDSSGPSGLVKESLHFPVISPLGGSLGRSGSLTSKRRPSTNTNLILVFSLKRSPSVITRLAIFPFSIEPRRSATPKISAGESVSARKAASGASPASMDFLAALCRSFGFVVAPEEKANLTPDFTKAAGLDGG